MPKNSTSFVMTNLQGKLKKTLSDLYGLRTWAEIRGYGVKSLALFGSVARDEATANSDIDLLVEFDGKVTFDCYMDLKFFLEDSLGCPVDVVSKNLTAI